MQRRENYRSKNGPRSTGFGRKAAATAGSFSALYLLPVVAQGAIVFVSGQPVSLTLGSTGAVTWSVDGNGGTFQLLGRKGAASSTVILGSRAPGSHGYGFVAPVNHGFSLQALPASFNVGPTLAKYFWGRAYSTRYLMRGTGTGASRSIALASSLNGFHSGDNFVGFRFTGIDSLLHYGWADLNLDTTNGIVTVEDWAYNNVHDAPIHIPDTGVPEPSSLALLAIGVGGLAAFRRRKDRNAAVSK